MIPRASRDCRCGPGSRTANKRFPVPGAVEYAESRETLNGVRPRMNLDSWGGYLSNPVIGGTSPSVNPQLDFAQASGARGNFLCGGELLGSRFGRKAQDRFLLMAAGQAYNVEMGVSNDLFPTGRRSEERRVGKECRARGSADH